MTPFFMPMETKETIDLLKQLQSNLLAVQELEETLKNNPLKINELEQDTNSKKDIVTIADEDLQEEKVKNSKLEKERLGLQEQKSNKNAQTIDVKTNEQLWALQKEIKFLEDKISNIELDIIQSMEDIEEKGAKLNQAKAEFNEHKKENDAEIAKLKGEVTGLEKDLETARQDYSKIYDQIPGRYASLLERIQRSKGGSAMAEVVDSSCGACHFRIRPQAYLEVKMGTALHQCPNCSRILYYIGEEETEEVTE